MQLRIQSYSEWRRRLAPSDTRRWFLGAIGWRVELQRDPVWDIVIYWKRLLAALAVLAVAGYLAGVTALYYWWGRQAETRVAWIDLALAPGQPEKFRRMRGERLLALGQSRLEQGQLVEAAFNLQAGLARAPDNLAGRLALTRIWAVLDRARALKTIEDGLALSPNEPALLDALFDLYALMGAEAKALERSAALLAPDRQPPLTEAARRAVTNARASLLLAREPAAALALLATLPADAGARAGLRSVLLSLRALRQLGRDGEAAALFGQLPPAARREPRTEMELALAAGDAPAFESAVRRLKAETAVNPVETALRAIRGWHELRRPSLRDGAIVEFLRFHGPNERALQALGALAVELDLPLVLVRAAQEAERRRFNPFAFQVDETELALRRGDLAEARRRLPQWENTLPELPEAQRDVPELFARLVRAAGPDGDAQSAALTAHLLRCGGRLKPGFFPLVITVLERGGNLSAAAQAAEIGLRFLPQSDVLQREYRRLDEAVARRKIAEARMSAAAASPPPATAPDEPGAQNFDSGAAALAAVDEALALHQPDRALRMLRAVRRSGPEWLAESEPALAMREFRARRALGEMPAAMIVFRDLALKPGVARAAAFRLVRELIAEGEGTLALQLAREIVRLVPGERAAAVLLGEAEAAAPAEKGAAGAAEAGVSPGAVPSRGT